MDHPGEGEEVSSSAPYGVHLIPSGSPPGLSLFAPSDLSDSSDLFDKIARLSPPYQREIYYR